MAAPVGAWTPHTRPMKGVCSASVATTPNVGASVFAPMRHRLELKSATATTTTTASALPRPQSSPQGQHRGFSDDRASGNGGIAGKIAANSSTMSTAALAPATPSSRTRRRPPLSPPPSSPNKQHQQRLPAWLGSAVRRAVLSLDEAPLFVVKTRPFSDDEDDFASPSTSSSSAFTTHALPKAALSAPALWPAIAKTVVASEGNEPEALLLVHKIEDENEVSSSSSHSRTSHHHLRLSDFEALERGGIATAELAGCVGTCCHGDEEEASSTSSSDEGNFIDSDLRSLIAPRSPSSSSSTSHWSSSAASSDTDVAFYGVVVQTTPGEKRRRRASNSPPSTPFSFLDDITNDGLSSAAGCFVLKTVRTRSSSPGGCTCVYYSLTRVGRAGEPLAEQLKQSWLV